MNSIPTDARAADPDSGDLLLAWPAPAADWNEAAPVGNGRLGAMVFGGAHRARIQLNDSTVWSGTPGGPAAALAAVRAAGAGPDRLAEVRAAIRAGDHSAAEALLMSFEGPYSQEYLPYADLWLTVAGGERAAYRGRTLNLDNGVAEETFDLAGTAVRRRTWADATTGALCTDLTADGRRGRRADRPHHPAQGGPARLRPGRHRPRRRDTRRRRPRPRAAGRRAAALRRRPGRRLRPVRRAGRPAVHRRRGHRVRRRRRPPGHRRDPAADHPRQLHQRGRPLVAARPPPTAPDTSRPPPAAPPAPPPGAPTTCSPPTRPTCAPCSAAPRCGSDRAAPGRTTWPATARTGTTNSSPPPCCSSSAATCSPPPPARTPGRPPTSRASGTATCGPPGRPTTPSTSTPR